MDVSIPIEEGSFSRVGCVYLGRPWSGPKLVRVIQVFIRLSPHLDAQRSSSTDSSTSAAKIVFKCDGIDAGADDKSVEKLSKS